jgi:hypothetical protein
MIKSHSTDSPLLDIKGSSVNINGFTKMTKNWDIPILVGCQDFILNENQFRNGNYLYNGTSIYNGKDYTVYIDDELQLDPSRIRGNYGKGKIKQIYHEQIEDIYFIISSDSYIDYYNYKNNTIVYRSEMVPHDYEPLCKYEVYMGDGSRYYFESRKKNTFAHVGDKLIAYVIGGAVTMFCKGNKKATISSNYSSIHGDNLHLFDGKQYMIMDMTANRTIFSIYARSVSSTANYLLIDGIHIYSKNSMSIIYNIAKIHSTGSIIVEVDGILYYIVLMDRDIFINVVGA